ncbi:MAG: hypothetical protein ACR2NZ_21705 [Rubripirellula sp.]
MGEINLSNSAGRDAVVTTESVSKSQQIRWLDSQSRQSRSVRIIKSTTEFDIDALVEKHGDLDSVATALVQGDPEIDFENSGRFLTDTSRVYVDQHRGIVRNVRFLEVVKNADGTVRQERPRRLADTNISTDTPLRWSGFYIPKEEAVRKFVFSGKAQLHHVNGLTFDFLYGMAKELDERGCLMLLGAGSKSNQPLILRRGGTPYRGFLEGRIEGDKYCLLLHFSNLELKVPEPEDDEE